MLINPQHERNWELGDEKENVHFRPPGNKNQKKYYPPFAEKPKKKIEDLSRIGSSHSHHDENITIKPIDGEDVQSLSIRDNELKKLMPDKPKPSEKLDPILVKKANPKAFPTIEVKVAKLVPNKPTKPIDYSENLGIRFDKLGNCVPYSILGTVEDFLRESVSNGKPIDLPFDTTDTDRPYADSYVSDGKPEKKKRPVNFDFNSDGGQKALNNWERKMTERKSVQDLVSKKLNRNANELVMNQYDALNKRNQLATVLDRALPLVENGKGNRFGSEFWNQPFQIGDDDNGIFTTLGKSDKGILSDIEQIDKPALTFRETHFDSKQPNLNTYPWSKSKYLQQRLIKLEPIIKELVPHQVEFDELQVKGSNPFKRKTVRDDVKEIKQNEMGIDYDDEANYTWVNPDIGIKSPPLKDNNGFMHEDDVLASYEDVVDEPIFGPCVIFGGQTAYWTGGDIENEGVIALESRLNFETKAGKRVLGTFEIFNAGTCAIYYDWKKIKEINPFQIVNANEQRFYFDTRSNVILPGDVLKLHIVFKSKKGGIFTEKWEFITRPMLLSGASLVLTLRGIAIQEDKFKKRRISLEKNLFMREAEVIAKDMMELILAGVRTPVRPSSPIDFKLIEDKVFEDMNHSVAYDQEVVDELKELYSNLMTNENDGSREEWNLSVRLLKEKILALGEVDPVKCHEKLATLNSYLDQLSLKPYFPISPKAKTFCYTILCSSFDEIFNELNELKNGYGLPLPITAEIYPMVDEVDKKFEDWKKDYEVMKQIELEKKNRLEKGAKGGEKTKKVEKVEKKKEKPKTSATPSVAKSRNSRESALSRTESRIQEKSSMEEKAEPIILTEEQLFKKQLFREKAYINVYLLLVKMFDNIEQILEITAEPEELSWKNFLDNNRAPIDCDYFD